MACGVFCSCGLGAAAVLECTRRPKPSQHTAVRGAAELRVAVCRLGQQGMLRLRGCGAAAAAAAPASARVPCVYMGFWIGVALRNVHLPARTSFDAKPGLQANSGSLLTRLC
jgi:hypothetical protein